MPRLEIALANPGVRCVRRPGVTWLLTGCGPDDADRLERAGSKTARLESEICARAGDATIIRVVHRDGRARSVDLWRGATSVHEVYHLTLADGALVVADTFRSALARLPADERAPSEDSILDHFLFRATPGHDTYSRRIARVGHGEQVSLDLSSGKSTTSIFQKLHEPARPGGVRDYLDRVDRALDGVLNPLKQRDDVAALFSGGVDSTLLHTYLGRETAALNLAVDATDVNCTMEGRYAQSAADSLGIALDRRHVPQSEFLGDLERATDEIAMPVHHGMLAVFARAFSCDYGTYVSAFNADSLFGHSAKSCRLAALFANPFLMKCLDLGAPAYVRRDLARRSVWRERLEYLRSAAHGLSEAPDSMRGLGARVGTYTEFDVAEMIFGREAIARRLERRFDYLIEHVALTAPEEDKLFRHLELACWMESLCRNLIPQLRHLGMASGKSVSLPFYSGSVVRSTLSIPVGDRYIRHFQGKFILKYLLKRRLPGYAINQRKGSTALANFPRHYQEGPASRIWERYELPDFIEGAAKNHILSSPLNITYSTVSYAIWKRRVLENPRIEPLPTEQRYVWSEPEPRPARESAEVPAYLHR